MRGHPQGWPRGQGVQIVRMAGMFDVSEHEEEAALLARYAAGDQAAARALTEQFLPLALRQAWRVLGSEAEAEEVAQEAMLKLWRQAPSWRAGEARVSTWLYRVTQNLCIDRIRRRRATANVDDLPEPADPAPGVLERLSASDDMRRLARAIMALPQRQRDALVMRHFDGASNPDIAERLDCSVEAVESLLARARRQLQKELAPEAPE